MRWTLITFVCYECIMLNAFMYAGWGNWNFNLPWRTSMLQLTAGKIYLLLIQMSVDVCACTCIYKLNIQGGNCDLIYGFTSLDKQQLLDRMRNWDNLWHITNERSTHVLNLVNWFSQSWWIYASIKKHKRALTHGIFLYISPLLPNTYIIPFTQLKQLNLTPQQQMPALISNQVFSNINLAFMFLNIFKQPSILTVYILFPNYF